MCLVTEENLFQKITVHYLFFRHSIDLNGPLTSVVVWAWLYVDLFVNPSEKCVIICCRKVPALETWDLLKIDTFGSPATLSLSVAIFATERAKRGRTGLKVLVIYTIQSLPISWLVGRLCTSLKGRNVATLESPFLFF